MEIAEKEGIKLVINFGLPSDSIVAFGLPNISSQFGLFQLTVLKPNWFGLILAKKNKLCAKGLRIALRHLCIVHSFAGFDYPVSLPPNFQLIGLTHY